MYRKYSQLGTLTKNATEAVSTVPTIYFSWKESYPVVESGKFGRVGD